VLRRKTTSWWLLGVLLFYLLVAPLVSTEPEFPFVQVLATFLMLGVLSGLSYSKKYLAIGIGLAVPAIVCSWIDRHFHHDGLAFAAVVFGVTELIYIAYLTIAHLWKQRRVDGDMLRLAIIGYLLIGAAWTGLYAIALYFDRGAIVPLPMDPDNPAVIDQNRARGALTYFSFVTMSTLGYGDIAPKTELARSLAMFQALLGQAYIAFVVAKLVALYIINNPSDAEREEV
jgi:hypothetical protein